MFYLLNKKNEHFPILLTILLPHNFSTYYVNEEYKYLSVSRSVMSNFLWPQRLQPTRFLCPWNTPGKNTGVGCHFLLQGIFLTQGSNLGLLHCRQILYHLSHQKWSEVAQSCPVLCDPMDCSLPGSSVHVIFQAEYWNGLSFPSPGDLPGIEPRSPALQADTLPSELPGKSINILKMLLTHSWQSSQTPLTVEFQCVFSTFKTQNTIYSSMVGWKYLSLSPVVL